MSEGLYGLIGVAIGAGLTFAFSLISNWQSNRAEQKRIRNRVLYYLFEIHHQLAKLELEQEEMFSFIVDYIQHRFKLPEPPKLEGEQKRQLETLLRNAMHTLVKEELKKIEEKYPDALQELSSIDPISAYRLHGVDRLFGRMEGATEQVKYVAEQMQIKGLDTQLAQIIESTFAPQAVIDTITQIENIVKDLSSWTLLKNTKKSPNAVLKRSRNTKKNHFEKEFKQILDGAFDQMERAQSAANLQGNPTYENQVSANPNEEE